MTDKEIEKIKKELKVDLNLTYYEFVALVSMTRGMVATAGERDHITESDQFCLHTLLDLSKKVEDKLETVIVEVGNESRQSK